MKIIIKVPDELVDSYKQFIKKYHAEQSFNDKTGALVIKPRYTVEEFLLFQINQLSDTVEKEFPTDATAEERAQIETLQAQMKEKLRIRKEADEPDEPDEPANPSPNQPV